jgi:hypothetical protein
MTKEKLEAMKAELKTYGIVGTDDVLELINIVESPMGPQGADKGRDNSLYAIRRRYEKANMQAIVMHDRVAFDSLRDVNYLLEVINRSGIKPAAT